MFGQKRTGLASDFTHPMLRKGTTSFLCTHVKNGSIETTTESLQQKTHFSGDCVYRKMRLYPHLAHYSDPFSTR